MRRHDSFEEECQVGFYAIVCGTFGAGCAIYGLVVMACWSLLAGTIMVPIGLLLCFLALKWKGIL